MNEGLKGHKLDEDGSWGRASQGWPETREYPHSKYVFCNMTGVVPYGMYVFMAKGYPNKDDPARLRVMTSELLHDLDTKFKIVIQAIKEEVRER